MQMEVTATEHSFQGISGWTLDAQGPSCSSPMSHDFVSEAGLLRFGFETRFRVRFSLAPACIYRLWKP